MRSCRDPYIYSDDVTFYVTNTILLPVLFGIGFIGNVLTLSTLTHSYLRTRHAVFVYMTGLATCDLALLILAMPDCIREIGAISRDVGFSLKFTHMSNLCYSFSQIFRHASAWIVLFMILVRYISLSWTYRPPRWVRISASRVLVLVIVLCAVIIDMPRFFEREPSPMAGQCYNATLYEWRYTEFGRRESYYQVYPWIIGSVCFLLPFSLTLLFATFHMIRTKIFTKGFCCKHDSVDVKIKSEYNNVHYSFSTSGFKEHQLDVTLIVVVMLYLLLEIPIAVTTMYTEIQREEQDILNPTNERHQMLRMVFTALSQVHSSINFLVYVTLSADFRKTFRRTCCCCTLGHGGENDDEFYEAVDCCALCPCPDQTEPEDEIPNGITSNKHKRSWVPNSKVRDSGDELWI